MRVGLALGLTVLSCLVFAFVAMSEERPRLAGTNNVFDRFPAVPLPAGQEACAQAELVPGETAAVRLHAEPEERRGGPLAVRLERGGRTLARGRLEGGWTAGAVDVPVRPVVERSTPGVDVCFANQGDGAIALWGAGAAQGTPQRTVREGEELNERIRLSYVRPGRESGWDLVGVVAHRMGIGRGSLLAGWALFGWAAALLGALAAVAVAVTRGSRA